MKLWKKQYPEVSIKAICTVVFMVLLYNELTHRHTIDVFRVITPGDFIQQHLLSLIGVFILMLCSVALEAAKWRVLLHHLAKISFMSATVAALSGYCVSFFTPNRTGEFAGRIVYLPATQRIRGAILTVAGSYSQLICTLIAGIWAASIYSIKQLNLPLFLDIATIAVCIGVSIVLLFSFFNIRLLTSIIGQIRILSKFQQQVSVLNVLPVNTLIQIMSLSVFKYVVFNLQFAWLLQMHGMAFAPTQLLYLLPLIFFIQTIIPTFAWAELGLRGSIAIYILHATGTIAGYVLIASTLLWVINIILPAIIGGILLLHHKFMTT